MSNATNRPLKPVEVGPSTVENFQYDAAAAELRRQPAYDATGRTAQAFARSDQLTLVLTVLKSGAEVAEHKAPGPATVTVLEGKLEFLHAPGGKQTLSKHEAVVFAAGIPHAIRALEDSTFLLAIGGRAG